MIIGELLVTVRELAEHINEPIDTDVDVAQANSMIRAASAKVRAAGDSEWTRLNCPEVAHTIALDAAARGYLNPALYLSERSDAQNFDRAKIAAQGTQLTADEIEILREQAGLTQGIWTITMIRPDTVSDEPAEGALTE